MKSSLERWIQIWNFWFQESSFLRRRPNKRALEPFTVTLIKHGRVFAMNLFHFSVLYIVRMYIANSYCAFLNSAYWVKVFLSAWYTIVFPISRFLTNSIFVRYSLDTSTQKYWQHLCQPKYWHTRRMAKKSLHSKKYIIYV